MTEAKNERPCPTCQGKGIIAGECESHIEWQGANDDPDGLVCTPDQECPTCKGSGVEKIA